MNPSTSRVARITGTITLAAALFIGASTGAQATTYYTAKDVAKHHTASNCWSIVGSSVYNLTKWIPKHPAGPEAIIGMCGRNGTVAFNQQHSSSPTAKAALRPYKIGTYKK